MDGSRVQFKIKKSRTALQAGEGFLQRPGLSMRRIRFRFDGQPINERNAPAQLEMDEDTNSRQAASAWPAASWGGGLPLEPHPLLALGCVCYLEQCRCGQAHRQAGSDTEDLP